MRYRAEWMLAGGVVLAAVLLALWLWPRGPVHTAQIAIEGKVVYTIDLDQVEEPYRISLEKSYGLPVCFEVRRGSVRFVDVVCPDHICERTGWVGEHNPIAVCMPNRVTLTCQAES